MNPDILADNWSVRHEAGALALTLPKEPDALPLESGSGRVIISDEFGDAFGVLEGDASSENLAFAFGRALDRLYGAEWGTADAPTIDSDASQAAFSGFGEDYMACWRAQDDLWLFAVVRPERQPLAQAFVEGASLDK